MSRNTVHTSRWIDAEDVRRSGSTSLYPTASRAPVPQNEQVQAKIIHSRLFALERPSHYGRIQKIAFESEQRCRATIAFQMRPLKFRPHPWHGLSPGPRFPEILHAYVELTPTDGVKYEIDKISGYLKVDRPQGFSNFCPTLYCFVPRTYCGEQVAAYTVAGVPFMVLGHYYLCDIGVLTD